MHFKKWDDQKTKIKNKTYHTSQFLKKSHSGSLLWFHIIRGCFDTDDRIVIFSI